MFEKSFRRTKQHLWPLILAFLLRFFLPLVAIAISFGYLSWMAPLSFGGSFVELSQSEEIASGALVVVISIALLFALAYCFGNFAVRAHRINSEIIPLELRNTVSFGDSARYGLVASLIMGGVLLVDWPVKLFLIDFLENSFGLWASQVTSLAIYAVVISVFTALLANQLFTIATGKRSDHIVGPSSISNGYWSKHRPIDGASAFCSFADN